jgi:hypothetical protein
MGFARPTHCETDSGSGRDLPFACRVKVKSLKLCFVLQLRLVLDAIITGQPTD